LPVFLTRDESRSTIARGQVLKMQVSVDVKHRIQCLRYGKK
jgi:BioD-like phosphotransacetylase family protein